MADDVFLPNILTAIGVYWNKPGNDGFGGESWDSDFPTEVNVRWEQRVEVFRDLDGKEQISKSVVFVDEDLEVEGYLALGELTDLDSTFSPHVLSIPVGLIKGFEKVPSIDGTKYVRRAFLI